jgi:integrase
VYIKARALPGGGKAYRARYFDPMAGVGGKVVYKTLESSLSTAELRREWAIKLAKNLAKQRAAIDAGDTLQTNTPIAEAVKLFFEARGDKAASGNQRRKTGIARFVAWAQLRRVERSEDLTAAHLSDLRTWLMSARRLAVVKSAPGAKAKRGQRRPGSSGRRAVTVNTDLTSVKVLLNHLRALGRAPKLSRDVIRDQLKPVDVHREDPEFLSSAQIRELLVAAEDHDKAKFVETRGEHAGEGRAARGSTPKHAPITNFVKFLLWTGCRRGEALSLLWSDVDLNAVDADSKVVGEIRLRASETKTKRARTIGLEVSPALRDMLLLMREASGGTGLVFEGYTREVVDRARDRLMSKYRAPKFDWQVLRSTCATYLTNSQSIFKAATVFLSARQLGHSVAVAEKHYLGSYRGVPKEARTLEQAMGVV